MIKLESKRTKLNPCSGYSFVLDVGREIECTILGCIREQIPSPIKPMHFAPFYGHVFSADIHVSKLFSSSQISSV
jgi:hypothetical protein